MQEKMYDMKLDEGFEDQLPLSDFLPGAASGERQQSMVPPLPEQPMPVVQQQAPAQQFSSATGLTPLRMLYYLKKKNK